MNANIDAKVDANPVPLTSISPVAEPDCAPEPHPRTRMLESAVATARQSLDKGELRFPRKAWRGLTSAYRQHHKETNIEEKEFFNSEFERLKKFANSHTPRGLKPLSEIENTDVEFWVMQKFMNVITRDNKGHTLPLSDGQTAFNNLVASELGTMLNISPAIQDGYSGLINDYINPTPGNMDRLIQVLSALAAKERL